MPEVRLVNITKKFGKTLAVDHLNLHVYDKEYVTLLGPSGCGKTTTLRIIAGLVEPDEGEVYIGDSPVYTENPKCPGGPHLSSNHDDYVDQYGVFYSKPKSPAYGFEKFCNMSG